MLNKSALLAILAAAVLAAGIVFFALTIAPPQNGGGEVSAISSAAIGGPFTLIDTAGKPVTDRTYRGKWMLIYFGYTFCPDACPTALTNISAALQRLGRAADEIQPLFITVDPKRDTPAVMAEYLKSFDRRIVGLTGSEEQTAGAAKAYRVYVAPQKSDGDDYLVDHSAFFYLMNPQGKFVNVVAGDLSGTQMADKLRKLLARSGA
jgi:protein SCO1/2